ncbi:MAG: hypothetical protein Q4B28_05520 [bacterium]|nr:hypothetical protein [bacterium]
MLDRVQNIVYDTNYTAVVAEGGFVLDVQSDSTLVAPSVEELSGQADGEQKKPKSRLDRLMESLGLAPSAKTSKKEKKTDLPPAELPLDQTKSPLAQQVKELLQLPDAEYSDQKLTSQLRQYIKEVDTHYNSLLSDYKSHIAPSYRAFGVQNFNVSGILGKTYYTQEYPSYIDMLWTRDIMAMHSKWDMSFYLYPEDDSAIQSMLKQKTTQLKAELSDAMQKGITIDKEVEQQYRDVEMIREKLTTKEERYFEF